jgi:hypothetical protein
VHNHDQKLRDMTRSVLPSTARRASRNTRRSIHRAERHAAAAALARGEDPGRDWRGRVADMVSDRRGADKVAPLVRWALHRVGHEAELRNAPLHVQVEHFRRLLPDTTIGRHAVSHIADALEFRHPDPPYRWYRLFASHEREYPSIEPTLRRLYEAGYHRDLNRRLKVARLPLLRGPGDLEAFAHSANRETRRVVLDLAREVRIG